MLKLNCFVGHATSADVATTVPVPEEVEALLDAAPKGRLFYPASAASSRAFKKLVRRINGRYSLHPVRGNFESVVILFYREGVPTRILFLNTEEKRKWLWFLKKRVVTNVSAFNADDYPELTKEFVEWFGWLGSNC